MLVMEAVVLAVDLGGDAADDAVAAAGEEELDVGVAVEGVLLWVEALLFEEEQGGHPVGVAPVDTPGEPDERLEVPLGLDGRDAHFGCGGRLKR